MTHKGNIEDERLPDLRRCERMPWARPSVERTEALGLRFWEQSERRNGRRICIWLDVDNGDDFTPDERVSDIISRMPDPEEDYWKVMKHRLIKEGNESVTKCNQLKLPSPKDGKRYATDVADMALMFRIIESIPSKKAEPSQAPPGIRIERIYVKRTYTSQIPFQTAQHTYSHALAFQSARVKP